MLHILLPLLKERLRGAKHAGHLHVKVPGDLVNVAGRALPL